MSDSISSVVTNSDLSLQPGPETGLAAHLWRDPTSVPREVVRSKIAQLQSECARQTENADLWTCLGIAFAMDFQIHNSLKALSHAVSAQPNHFWARFKLAELHYRLRTLEIAEQESAAALALASDVAELAIAQKQLQTIRHLRREGTQKPAWSKNLRPPVLALAALLAVVLVWGALMFRPA